MKDNNVVVINDGLKKRGRGGKYNFPSTVEPEDPDVVRAAMGSVLYWYNRGKDKPETIQQIQDRVDEYLTECYQTGQRATVEKLALALGIHRDTLHAWETNRATYKEKSDIIKAAKDCIASYDADMVTSGKMNPVPYIFRAKNYYGMKDQQEITIEPKTGLVSDVSPDEIAGKYAELPSDWYIYGHYDEYKAMGRLNIGDSELYYDTKSLFCLIWFYDANWKDEIMRFFCAKNMFQYKDTQDVTITPNSTLQTDTSPVDIANKYNALPED